MVDRQLLDDDDPQAPAVVANCSMNRVRQLTGVNSYARELGLDPLGVLRAAIADSGTGAWLDLCCGTGRALIQAAIALVHALPVEPLEPGHFGVQIVGMNVQVDPRRARFQALHERHQVVPAKEGAGYSAGRLWIVLPARLPRF